MATSTGNWILLAARLFTLDFINVTCSRAGETERERENPLLAEGRRVCRSSRHVRVLKPRWTHEYIRYVLACVRSVFTSAGIPLEGCARGRRSIALAGRGAVPSSALPACMCACTSGPHLSATPSSISLHLLLRDSCLAPALWLRLCVLQFCFRAPRACHAFRPAALISLGQACGQWGGRVGRRKAGRSCYVGRPCNNHVTSM